MSDETTEPAIEQGDTVYSVEGSWQRPIIFTDPDEACAYYIRKRGMW